MNQLTLSLPYQPHSHASYEAAERAKETAKTQRARVLDALLRCGTAGATDEEISRITHLRADSARARRVGLVQLRRVVDSGTTRDTLSGRKATVWVAKEFIG